MSNTQNFGEICWFEIPVLDVARAQKFYCGIFGWEFNPEAVPQETPGITSLHLFNKGSTQGAFLLVKAGFQITQYGRLDKEVLPPLASFCVKECDETLQKVKELGGKTQCPKTAIGGDKGCFARFTDTEGNVIGIWSQN